jgi:hypothetical protein
MPTKYTRITFSCLLLCWRLSAGQLANLWCVTCYAPEYAFSKVEPLGLEVQRVFNSTSGAGRIESMRQVRATRQGSCECGA